ncbi:AI-2E family transporter [Candidatus Absconditicoccus praedator]|uniref:AI-2E family transporter n=1 Tax=Candidatus Absconditicoccus praedator TaxID=2735562 RepID=UPI001E3104C7|nr:AI-2E family transporter [Candidatus Absconditicoccus praedator]UFX83380.1 AI-2E family transporter [Candidatus Absconditicoccus praedator]
MKEVKSYLQHIVDKVKSKTKQIKDKNEKEFKEIEEIDKKADGSTKKSKTLIENVTQKADLRSILTFWLVGIFVVYLGYVLFDSLDLLYLVLAAFIISIAMEAVIDIFQKKLPRILSIVLAYLFLFMLLLSGFLVIVPFVLAQSADIVQIFLDMINQLQKDLRTEGLRYVIETSNLIPGIIKQFILEGLQDREVVMAIQYAIQENISQIASFGTNFINNIGGIVVSIVGGFFSALFQIFLVLVLAIFFSAQKDSVINFIAGVTNHKEYMILKIQKLYRKLGFWLKGQFLLSIFIFFTVLLVLNTIAVFGLDLPNKFTLALIAGITEFIPIIGPILGAIPAVLVAVSEYGLIGFLVIVIVYTLIQGFENYVLVPMVMNHALGVNALLILIAMLIGGSLMGFVGIVLSVPIAVIANLIFEDIVK